MAAADRLERLGSLFAYLLDAEVPKTRADIVAEFPFYAEERGRRRFEEDKAALLRAGIPLRSTDTDLGVGYEIRRADYLMPEMDLTEDELRALELAATAVGFDGVSWAQLGSARLDVPALRDASTTVLPGIDALPVVDDAVLTRTCLAFPYQGVDRVVEPWGVVFKRGRWYLIGFDQVRGAQRCFRLDRIETDQLDTVGDPGAFDRPRGLDLAAQVPDDPLTMGDNDVQVARLAVAARIVELLPGQPASTVADDDVRADGRPVVEVDVGLVPAFVSWVLGWGELVEVLDPPELRAAVVDRLVELAR
ncbi:MAG: WYL domain-containing protein [Acidimicrobiia bacterium]|nr:WYL domain-containing protein [Acidimicrobiia bacterium]